MAKTNNMMIPGQIKKASTESLFSEAKDPLDEQPHNLSKELNEPLTENQDKIQDDQDSLLVDSNVGKLEESLPSSSTEKSLKNSRSNITVGK